MKIKKLKNSDNAVVGIVAAFLIVGLVVAVLSVVQTQYVPKWMREKESDHMNELANQFVDLKYAIDIHTANKEPDIPISTVISLGSNKMPYLMSVKSYGQLKIIENGCNFTVIKNDSTEELFELGIIKYSSYNQYYIDQDYILEGGAVILSQPRGNTDLIKPSLSALYEKNVTIFFNMTNVSTLGKKDQSIVGYGPTPIQTEFLSMQKFTEIQNITNITINTSYVNAWYSILNSALIKAGLNDAGPGTNYTINTSIENKKVFVDFHDTITVNININIIEIGAQVDWGMIAKRN